MLISMGYVATGGQVDVCDLCCHLKPCWYLWSMLQPEALLIFLVLHGLGLCWSSRPILLLSLYWCACTGAKGNDDIYGSCCNQSPCGCLWSVFLLQTMLKSVARVTPERLVDMSGQCSHLRPCWCLCYMLQPEIMFMSMVYAPSRGHVVVCGLCYHQRLCWNPWPLLLSKVRLMCVAWVATWGHVGAFNHSISGGQVDVSAQVTTEDHEDIHGLYCYLNPFWCPWSIL